MRFSENLIGGDIQISNDKLTVSRKDNSDPINASTIAFSTQPLTINHIQSFIIDLNFKIYGFGKIGITTKNPFNTDLSAVGGKGSLWSSENTIENCITEFPLFDTCTNSFKNIEANPAAPENTALHLLIILNSTGEIHYFINFKYKGILFAEVTSGVSLWLFFDLSGCLTSVSTTGFNGAPDPSIFWRADCFRTYFTECAKRSLLCYQSHLTVIHTSKLDEVLCDILECKCMDELLESKRIFLNTVCDFRTGLLIPQGFSNKIHEKPVTENNSQWGYIGQPEISLLRDSSISPLFDNKTVRYNEKLDLFEAEELAFTILNKLKSKTAGGGIKRNSKNEISFTDLSTQTPSSFREPIEELSPSIGIEKLSLIEKLMSFFVKNSHRDMEVKHQTVKPKDEKKILNTEEKSYSSDCQDESTTMQSAEISVDITLYRSIVQFQIILAMGIREPGAHLITIDIDEYLIKLDLMTQNELISIMEQWLWILYQRGPDQVGPKSVIMVLCYNRTTLELLNSEKLIPNVQVIKRIASEVCCRNEYRMILNGDPIIFCPSSTNKAEKIDSIKLSVSQSICSSENVARLIPVKWIKFANAILELNNQQTKLLSFSQICQMTDEHDCKNIDDLITILTYLSHLGIIQWIGDKAFQTPDDLSSTKNFKIIDSQASVVVTDKQWLVKTIYGLEKDCKNHANSLETLETVLKSFFYHKLLFILLLKYPMLAVEQYNNQKLCTVFDYPLHPQLELFPIASSEKGVTIYFLYNQPVPWIFYLSFLLASSRMSSNYNDILFDTLNGSMQIQLEDNHEAVIYRITSKIMAVCVCSEKSPKISSEILVRVRQFMEQCIYQVIAKSLHRFTGNSAIKCPCNAPCIKHNKRKCNMDYSCLHFLYLDEILCNQAVFCGRRRILTAPWRDLFPPVTPKTFTEESRNEIIHKKFQVNSIWNTESQLGSCLPRWMLLTAKILSEEESSFNWQSLAMKLGYSDKIKKFEEDPNSALAMLVDWITTTGNNQLSVDFIILTLQEAGQYQISDIIESDPECQWSQPQVFISYQWHNQREAKNISDYLNKAGYTTWMDVGQMGGGDLLMHRIERAIRGCKVLIACISPRYIVSTICHREIVLADLLKKPIIPAMVLQVPWPPPGGTGLMLAPYVYIDLFGVGGHGGSGLRSDLSSRFFEIQSQVAKYCSPIYIQAEPQPSYKKISPLPSPKPTPVSSQDAHSSESHSTQLSSNQQSALNPTSPPATTSQVSVRECSSVCTLI